ncbi:hypothetical protein GUJ93_ZPchr0012g20338 [Zizania palustris]|uniref:Uncharacterized protein n=1 Tax=Zizania palustris TaxID=103762 RepID=A0A8J5WRT4_ZIZPA|nr:hypothetical protein GUJ93_ZPchr0012g20338 [Zizania palustris]
MDGDGRIGGWRLAATAGRGGGREGAAAIGRQRRVVWADDVGGGRRWGGRTLGSSRALAWEVLSITSPTSKL